MNSMFMDQSMDFGEFPDLLFTEDLLQVNNEAPLADELVENNDQVFGDLGGPIKCEGVAGNGVLLHGDLKQELEQQQHDLLEAVQQYNTENTSVVATFNIDEATGTVIPANNMTGMEDEALPDFLNDVVDANLASPATSTRSFEAENESGMVDTTQALINEMEDFLSGHEDEASVASPVANSTFTDEPAADMGTEDILNALMNGNITTDAASPLTNTQTNNDSGLGDISATTGISIDNISNISEIVTEDGKKIVIVITNDSKAAASANASANLVPVAQASIRVPARASPGPVASPTSSGSASPYHPGSPDLYSQDESDGEWCPPGQKVVTKSTPAGSKRKAEKTKVSGEPSRKRGPYKRSGALTIKDKKERKKMQNVEAARRYRDKKKAEQNVIESEEDKLVRTNNELKAKFSEMENEVKTLKKLMAELGLIK